MGKDLRTSAIQLKLHRYPKIDGTAWGIHSLQPYFPVLERLFKTETLSNLHEYGVRLSSELDQIVDPTHIRVGKKILPVHRKTTMILSPYKWMRGDYGAVGVPKPTGIADEIQERLQSPHTAGYVGALTSILLSESGCPHFPKVYGVFTGIASSHVVDISDDYEDLADRPWFPENIGKTFDLKVRTGDSDVEFTHTRRQRPGLEIGEETLLGEIEDLHPDHVSNPGTLQSASELQESETESMVEDDDETSDSEDVFEIESCDCSSEEADFEEEGDEEEAFAWAHFKNVPVITTVMEVCEGSFYHLIHEHPEPEKHAAWVAQLTFALAYAQRMFGLTHNDLHGNNVMYVKTDQEFMYYNYGGQCYRVPTYGYLIKVIDFDRAIVSVRLPGMKEPRTFVSSQFHQDEEAAGQYNLDPFHVRTHPHIHPNASFDLARFATSVFWDLFPKGPDHEYTHPLFDVFKQWMTAQDGTSVMFRKKRDNHDRYHGFHLYKAIARYCKDNAVPRKELSKLSVYQIPVIPIGNSYITIET
jgi:hypothetical protein